MLQTGALSQDESEGTSTHMMEVDSMRMQSSELLLVITFVVTCKVSKNIYRSMNH